MKYDVDQLLQQALSPEKEPDVRLNQRILQKAEETESMARKGKMRIPAAALVAALTLMIGSASVYAAWKYLTPDQVAEIFEDEDLSRAFQSEDAVLINEVQEMGGYKITLLGIVSGRELSKYERWNSDSGIREDRSYVVTAIENADGTPRPLVSDDSYGEDPFCVSPLIGGLSPNEYNVMTMSGNYSEYVVDGIQYRITECDNVEIFADRGLYLSVNGGAFFANTAYIMNEETGEIVRNEAYDGVNALFELPIDESKADPAAAEAYIQAMEGPQADAAPEISGEALGDSSAGGEAGDGDVVQQVSAIVENWELEDFNTNAQLLESQVLTPDADGYISYVYEIGEEETSSSVRVEALFEEEQTGLADTRFLWGNDPVYIDCFVKNENGTISLFVYQYINP